MFPQLALAAGQKVAWLVYRTALELTENSLQNILLYEVLWAPLIWSAFLQAKSAHISRKTFYQKNFYIWKAIWGSNILPI